MSEPINTGDTVKLADPTQGNDTENEGNMAQDGSGDRTDPVTDGTGKPVGTTDGAGSPVGTQPSNAVPAAAPAQKEPKNWTSYVHLANGDVIKANAKMLDQISADGNTFRDNGNESAVIGIYPRDVEFEEPKEDDDE